MPTPPPDALRLEGCTGWYAHVYYPIDQGPGQAFPGWEPEPGPFHAVQTFGFDCERMALGPFERPVRLIFDYHNNFNSPEDCGKTGEVTSFWILGSLLVNDSEVAAYMQANLGLPAMAADIQWSLEEDAVSVATWRWTVAGTTSQVQLYDDSQDAPTPKNVHRVFWRNTSGGVSAMQLHYEVTGPAFTTRLAVADFQEPMLNAGQPHGQLDLAEYYRAGSLSAPILAWKDMACAAPL